MMFTELLNRANAAWYRWPEAFGILTADLHVAATGGCHHGQLVLSRGEGLETSFASGAPGALQRAAIKDLAVVLGMFSGDDRAFSVDTDAAYELVESGNPLGSRYRAVGHPAELLVRIAHGQVTEVSRSVGPNVVTHLVHERMAADDGASFATRFARIIRRQGSSGLEAHQTVTVAADHVGGLLVPVNVKVLTSDGEGAWLWQASLSNVAIQPLPDIPADLFPR
jgi:hypothetical protein